MRVRELELRLLAGGLAALWAGVAGLLLVGYRPGGPADLLVGIAALAPLAVAIAPVAWPPAARGPRAFRVIAALGVATILVLLPTLGGLVRQLVDEGSQALVPSLEVAYAWALAILGTSLFAGLGLARRIRGPGSGRQGRLTAALAIGAGLAALSTAALAGAVAANELALRDQPAGASRYGPTDPGLVPPPCDTAPAAGPNAVLALELEGSVDARSLGLASIAGGRSGADFRWRAAVTTTREVGLAGAAAIGSRGWVREPGTRWRDVSPEVARRQALDLSVAAVASDPILLGAAEDRGLVYVEGARARRCRLAIDGTAFRDAFPQVRWLVGETDLGTWRGNLDVWVFADGQLGRAEGRLEGPGFDLEEGAIRGGLAAVLTATNRATPVSVVPPAD